LLGQAKATRPAPKISSFIRWRIISVRFYVLRRRLERRSDEQAQPKIQSREDLSKIDINQIEKLHVDLIRDLIRKKNFRRHLINSHVWLSSEPLNKFNLHKRCNLAARSRLMRLGHVFNILARYSDRLAKVIKGTGVRDSIRFLWRTMPAPWLDYPWLEKDLAAPFSTSTGVRGNHAKIPNTPQPTIF